MINPLPKPKRYFPVSKNPFTFTAGLTALKANEKIIQIDSNYPTYIKNKIQNREKSFDQYVQKRQLNEELENIVIQYLIQQLTRDWPAYFEVKQQNESLELTNKLSNENILFNNENLQLINNHSGKYKDSLDALLMQIQEDISIVELHQETDSIIYLHLCSPNFWSAEEKIGTSFIESHTKVPDMEKMKQNHLAINQMLASSGPFERFTWGLTTNNNLNQHPLNNIASRDFENADEIYMRVERQVTIPLPNYNSYIFFIRTYFLTTKQLNTEEITRLIYSLNTMSADIALYKGMAKQREMVISRLKAFI